MTQDWRWAQLGDIIWARVGAWLAVLALSLALWAVVWILVVLAIKVLTT